MKLWLMEAAKTHGSIRYFTPSAEKVAFMKTRIPIDRVEEVEVSEFEEIIEYEATGYSRLFTDMKWYTPYVTSLSKETIQNNPYVKYIKETKYLTFTYEGVNYSNCAPNPADFCTQNFRGKKDRVCWKRTEELDFSMCNCTGNVSTGGVCQCVDNYMAQTMVRWEMMMQHCVGKGKVIQVEFHADLNQISLLED